jgi:cathepsin C
MHALTFVSLQPISRWEKTNHAVMCVGYGSDVIGGREIKWWKMKNSWGPGFGEGGYFRVVRGVDMLAIESMPVVIDI